jgi:hypothetical protein
METLNNAARAAGFAMATADELLDSTKPEVKGRDEAWRPGEAIMPKLSAPHATKAAHGVAGWLKGRFFGLLGRSAPA